eukprot:1156013-Pelagomonas_calceolata.AAC.8
MTYNRNSYASRFLLQATSGSPLLGNACKLNSSPCQNERTCLSVSYHKEDWHAAASIDRECPQHRSLPQDGTSPFRQMSVRANT